MARNSILSIRPSNGDQHQRQSRRQPMRDGFGSDDQFQRQAAHGQKIERSILFVGGEQTIQRQQAREQCAEPENGWTDPRQKLEVGPDGKGNHRDHDQEKQRAHWCAAPDSKRNPDIAAKQGDKSGHGGPRRISWAPSRPMGPWAAATTMPPCAK
jgi:hypothetical protein